MKPIKLGDEDKLVEESKSVVKIEDRVPRMGFVELETSLLKMIFLALF